MELNGTEKHSHSRSLFQKALRRQQQQSSQALLWASLRRPIQPTQINFAVSFGGARFEERKGPCCSATLMINTSNEKYIDFRLSKNGLLPPFLNGLDHVRAVPSGAEMTLDYALLAAICRLLTSASVCLTNSANAREMSSQSRGFIVLVPKSSVVVINPCKLRFNRFRLN